VTLLMKKRWGLRCELNEIASSLGGLLGPQATLNLWHGQEQRKGKNRYGRHVSHCAWGVYTFPSGVVRHAGGHCSIKTPPDVAPHPVLSELTGACNGNGYFLMLGIGNIHF